MGLVISDSEVTSCGSSLGDSFSLVSADSVILSCYVSGVSGVTGTLPVDDSRSRGAALAGRLGTPKAK